MKKKTISLALILSAMSLISCAPTTSESTSVPDSTVGENVETLPCSFVHSQYGEVKFTNATYIPGKNVSLTLTSFNPSVHAPYGVKVNQDVIQATDGTVAISIPESGAIIEPLFRRALTDFEVHSTDTAIFVEEFDNAQYKLDDGEWQSSHSFLNLEANSEHTVSVMLKEEGDLYASEVLTKTISTQITDYFVDDVLDKLTDGEIAFKGTLNTYQMISGISSEPVITKTVFDNELFMSNERYYLKSAFADDKQVKQQIDVRRGNDDKAEVGSISIDNTITYRETDTSYSSNYLNPLWNFVSNDFTQISENTLSLNVKNKETDANALGKYLVNHVDDSNGEPFELKGFYIDLTDSGEIAGLRAYLYYTTTGYDYKFDYWDELTLTVTDATNLDMLDVQKLTFDDTQLSSTLTALQAGNYHADINITYALGASSSYSYDSYKEENGQRGVVVSLASGNQYGYHDTDEGMMMYDVFHTGENTVSLRGRKNYPSENTTVDSHFPKFNVATALFEYYGGNSYGLKNKLGIYSFVNQLAPDTVFADSPIGDIDAGSFRFNLVSEGVSISYTATDRYGYQYTVSTTINKIGSVEKPFDFADNFVEYQVPTSWEGVDPELYSLLLTYVDDPEQIPFYYDDNYGFESYGETVTKDSIQIKVHTPDETSGNNFYNAYVQKILDAGYTKNTDSLPTYVKGKYKISINIKAYDWSHQNEKAIFIWIYKAL